MMMDDRAPMWTMIGGNLDAHEDHRNEKPTILAALIVKLAKKSTRVSKYWTLSVKPGHLIRPWISRPSRTVTTTSAFICATCRTMRPCRLWAMTVRAIQWFPIDEFAA
jgi:hypothetical protein